MKLTSVITSAGLVGAVALGGFALGGGAAQADVAVPGGSATSAPAYEWYFVRAYPDSPAGEHQCVVDGSNGFPAQWRYYECRYVPANPANYYALYVSQ